VLPLVYETVLSSPTPLTFAWQEDVWNIVVRGQEDFTAKFAAGSRGMYLRSGAFDTALAGGLAPLGLSWAAVRGMPVESGLWRTNNFILVAAPEEYAGGAAELSAAITASTAPVTVLSFGAKAPLTVAMLEGLLPCLQGANAVVMVTPQHFLENDRDAIPTAAGRIAADPSPWLRRPAVLFRLAAARTALEEYKNSGLAQLKTLAALRDEIYAAYRFDLLARLNGNPQPEDEQLFLAHLRNIYMLLKRPLPPEMSAQLDDLPAGGTGGASSFAVTVDSGCLSLVNTSAPGVPGIAEVSVRIRGEEIVYTVALNEQLPAAPWAVDIYMDLNNQRGAGLARLLTGLNAFMEPQDAWEYALRIENGQAALYRSGRFEPTLVRRFTATRHPWTVSMPRAVLRGNPLGWGYQAVLHEQHGSAARTMCDFLCSSQEMKQKTAAQTTVQLPAFRARSSSAEYR
jgi:hypothetical protein